MNAVVTRPSGPVFWRPLRLGMVALAALLALAVGAWMAFRAWGDRQAEAELREAIARTDESEPRWQWHELLTDRRPVAAAQNAALRVQEAAGLLPSNRDWPGRRAEPVVVFDVAEPDRHWVGALAGAAGLTACARLEAGKETYLGEGLCELVPGRPLPAEMVAELRADLAKRGPALALARQVADLPQGRYPEDWHRIPMRSLLPHNDHIRRIGNLLQLDLALAAEEGDLARALVDCRALFNLARSVGDEPVLIMQLVRLAMSRVALTGLERLLARGELAPADLDGLRALVRREVDDPVFEIAARGERASMFETLRLVAAGEVSLDEVLGQPPPTGPLSGLMRWSDEQPLALRMQKLWVEQMTPIVEHSRRRGPARRRALEECGADLDRAMRASSAGVVLLLVASVLRMAEAFERDEAWAEAADVALALEQYRRRHGRWPQTLAQLVPADLPRVPEDPFGDGPLRYARTETGVVVYSVGPDGRDDGGKMLQGFEKAGDLPFRLLDPERRRPQPEKAP